MRMRMVPAVVTVLLFSCVARADSSSMTCIENSVTGCVVGFVIQTTFVPVGFEFASDGEASFDPFGVGFDTSDGLGVSRPIIASVSPGWVMVNPDRVVLPADLSNIGCGSENEPNCEPAVIHFTTGFQSPGSLTIFEAGTGIVSDQITWKNDPNGHGLMTFASDPIAAVPEPSGFALLASGLGGLAAILRKLLIAG